MKILEIAPTLNSPHVILDSNKGYYLIEGKAFPEDSKFYFHPILEWIREYKLEKPKKFELNINLLYISSSSIIAIKQILVLLMDCQVKGTEVTINWHFDEDDEDIKLTGEDYMKITNLQFVFKVNK